jgi:hypothetical protein
MSGRTLVETAPHEFQAHLLFEEHGLAPFFACHQRTEQGDISPSAGFVFRDERWTVTLSARKSGLAHPGPTLPSGTEFPVDEMREFQLQIQSEDDPVGERKADVHLAPRWPEMQSKNNGQNPSTPDGIGEAVNLHVQGANIEFEDYRPLIECAAAALEIRPEFFRTCHNYSTVLEAERYVRLNREVSGPVYARDGPITQLGHLLENDRQGQRRLVQRDDDRHGRNRPGFNHAVTLGSMRIQKAFPSHHLPKQIKHYYAREVHALDSTDPLAHPKLGALYKRKHWDGTVGVATEDLAELNRELEEAIFGVLAEAGIPLTQGLNTYVEDPYFQVEASERERTIPELEFERVREQQEAIVTEYLADGLPPTAWEALEVLVSDGGTLSPKRIAEQTDRHPGSVRRALRRIPGLVERAYGEVALRSQYVAELVLDTVRAARERSNADKENEVTERRADESPSAFFAWAEEHDIEIRNRDSGDRLTLDMQSVDEWRKRIREGYDIWVDVGLQEDRFRTARVLSAKESESNSRYLSGEKRTRVIQAWRYIS